jgi:hypothetical protein
VTRRFRGGLGNITPLVRLGVVATLEILGIVAKYTKIASEVLKSIPIRVTPESLAPDLKLAAEMEAYYRGQNVLTYQGKIDFNAFYSQDIVDRAVALAGR